MNDWSGVGLPIEMIDLLEPTLCRVGNRRTLCGGNVPSIAKHGASSMIGCLFNKTYDIVKEIVNDSASVPKKSVPKKDEIRKAVGIDGGFSKFLGGRQQSEKWIKQGRRAMLYLLTGRKDISDVPPTHEAAIRIDDYFFAPGPDVDPRYFSAPRAASADAWCYKEVAGELRALAGRARVSSGMNATIWYVSGGPDFLPSDLDEQTAMLNGFDACSKAGVRINFVQPAGENAIATLQSKVNGHDLNFYSITQSAPVPVANFFTPHTRYLFLSLGKDSSDLWILRSPSSQDRIGPIPCAYCGLRDEVQAFQSWVPRLVADPARDASSKPPPSGAGDLTGTDNA